MITFDFTAHAPDALTPDAAYELAWQLAASLYPPRTQAQMDALLCVLAFIRLHEDGIATMHQLADAWTMYREAA